jgi:hypothetical protein
MFSHLAASDVAVAYGVLLNIFASKQQIIGIKRKQIMQIAIP